MHKKLLLCLILIGYSCCGLLAQSFQLAGYLLDDSNGEPIAHGQIRISEGPGLLSDFNGYFRLDYQPKGEAKVPIIVSALGYQTDTLLLAANTQSANFNIRLAPLFLNIVEVVATARNLNKQLSPSVERLKQVPVLLGQTDLVKALTLYPGVAAGQEGLSGFHVRGGDAFQNLVRLDGSTLYNPGHLFGFLSVFNPDVVRSFDLHKDFIPARFGGRLASVLDVSTIDGNEKKRQTAKEFGFITTAYTTQGPLRDSSWIYHLGGRLSHSAWVSILTVPTYLARKNPLLAFGTFDLNAKLVKRYENGAKLRLSSYLGEDAFGGIVRADSSNTSGTSIIQYGNFTTALQYVAPNKKGNLRTTSLNYNAYRNIYKTKEVFSEEMSRVINRFSNKSRIQEISLSHQFEGSWLGHAFQWGGSLTNRWIEPVAIRSTNNTINLNTSRFLIRTLSASAYADWAYAFHANWRLDAGLRLNLYHTFDPSFNDVQPAPRLALNWLFSEKSLLFASYNRTTQDLHAAELLVAGVPTLVWLPATETAPVEHSNIYSMGYKTTRRHGQSSLGLYYKQLFDQVILPGFSFAQSNNRNWENEIIAQGDGYAFGLECYHESSLSNAFFMSLSYTYSRSFRRFAEINQGQYFPYNFDRPHDFNLQLQAKLSSKWQLATAFYYQTSRPITAPTALGSSRDGLSLIYPKLNNARLPDYHRVDVSLSKKTLNKKGREGKLTFGIYNIYGRPNALSINYSARGTGFINPETGVFDIFTTPNTEVLSLFRFFPIFSYEVRY